MKENIDLWVDLWLFHPLWSVVSVCSVWEVSVWSIQNFNCVSLLPQSVRPEETDPYESLITSAPPLPPQWSTGLSLLGQETTVLFIAAETISWLIN